MILSKAKTLKGFKLHSLEGEIGKVEEFYFDDRHWIIRYLVADTGKWLSGRQVLISPYALGGVDREKKLINVYLTKKQIEHSPSLHCEQPISRQFETDYFGYYGWPIYWGSPSMWGSSPYLERDSEKWKNMTIGEKVWDPHLRSTHQVTDYNIQAIDGEIGHVDDFIIDDETWAIRYLIVNTRNWWPGKKVLLSPRWIESVSWEEGKVFVNLLRESIKKSPEYTEESMLTRDYEAGLHRHYNLHGYWVEEDAPRTHQQ
jgi:uncharacterized protein YrrD